MLGEGAQEFAMEMKMEMVENSYFMTENRKLQLQQALSENKSVLDHDINPIPSKQEKENLKTEDDNKNNNYGTVGCVAIG